MIKLILHGLALTFVGTVSSAFLLVLLGQFEPELHGFFHRWFSFSWRYCWPAGLVSAALFFYVHRSQIANL